MLARWLLICLCLTIKAQAAEISGNQFTEATTVNESGQVSNSCHQNYQPVQVSQPAYPRRAASRGIEGYAVVRFDLARDGSKQNMEVVESVPPRVFDRAALMAAEETRYLPCEENQIAMAIEGLSL
ncbi:MAG: energy transducer TonB, partial [Gammaproteobacteria bacterium]|nr:energy transducer TonB [Gammaproteobacteria bacterium]